MFSFLGYLDAKRLLFINYFDIILKIFDVLT